MQDDFNLPSLPKVLPPTPAPTQTSAPPALPPPENRALATTDDAGKDLAVSSSAEDALAQIASSITDLVEIQIENRDLVSEQTDLVKKDHVIDATENKEDSGSKSSIVEEDDRNFKQRTADTLSKMASHYDSFKDGLREVANVAMSPTLLLDKLPNLMRWGAGKLRGDSADNDAFDPETVLNKMSEVRKESEDGKDNDAFDPEDVLNRMSEVREDLAKATEQHSEETAQVLQEEIFDIINRLVEDSPLVEALDRLTETLQGIFITTSSSPASSFWGTDIIDLETPPPNTFWGNDVEDAEFSYAMDYLEETKEPWYDANWGWGNVEDAETARDFKGVSTMDAFWGVDKSELNDTNNLNTSSSPSSLAESGSNTKQSSTALLGQAVNFLRQMSVRGTKSSPMFTYLLDYDVVAGEEGLYESFGGQDFQPGAGVEGSGSDTGNSGKLGKVTAGAGNILGDMKWVAISAAIIALAEPIDKLVTAMTDPETGFGKIVNAIGGFAESMLAENGPIMKLVNAITDMVATLAGPITDFLVSFVKEVGPPIAKLAGLLAETLLESLTSVINGLRRMVDEPTAFWSDMANALISGFTAFFTEFVGQIGDAIANSLSLSSSHREQVALLLDMGFNHSQARDLAEGKDIRIKNGSQFGLADGVMLEAVWDKSTQSHTFRSVDVGTYRNYGNYLKGKENIGEMSEGRDVTAVLYQTVFGDPGPVLAPS